MTKMPKAANAASKKTEETPSTKTRLRPMPKQARGRKSRPPVPLAPADKGTARKNTKQARLIEMMQRAGGVPIQQIMDFTGWQQHSVRGFLSGTIKKKLGLTVISEKDKDGVRTYRIKAS